MRHIVSACHKTDGGIVSRGQVQNDLLAASGQDGIGAAIEGRQREGCARTTLRQGRLKLGKRYPIVHASKLSHVWLASIIDKGDVDEASRNGFRLVVGKVHRFDGDRGKSPLTGGCGGRWAVPSADTVLCTGYYRCQRAKQHE